MKPPVGGGNTFCVCGHGHLAHHHGQGPCFGEHMTTAPGTGGPGDQCGAGIIYAPCTCQGFVSGERVPR